MLALRIFSARLLAALIAGSLFAACVAPAIAQERPNFIIVIADDVSVDDVGCYGHPHIRTPNFDLMARQGLRFDAAFLTCSSCSPSRCSIMTGRYPHATGAAELHQPLPADQTVFAGLLKEAGYYTASAGKWHLGDATKKNFDLVVGGGPSGAENWEQVVRERPREKPFFFWFAAIDAHRPYRQGTLEHRHSSDDAVAPPFFPDVPAVRADLADYYDEISRLDDYTGRVLALLESQGVAENTLVLVMADNGRPFPRCKTTLYDSGVQTPFIVHWPAGVKPGGVTRSLVSSVDIAPTLLELAGVELPDTFQGKSFAPILADPEATTREFVFAEHNWHDYQAHERSVRSAQYLYIHNAFPELTGSPPADAVRSPTYNAMQMLHAAGKLPPEQQGCFVAPRPAEELYDVQTDPHQLRNLAGDPKFAGVLKRMRGRLAQWREETGDAIPENPTPDRFDRQTGKRL